MNHHAYLYIGNDISVVPDTTATPNIDVEHIVTERLSIDDARKIKESAYRRPQEAKVRQIVLQVKDMPIETQNALLKLFEEPPADCVFHIVVPRRDMLLPTLLSRVSLVDTVAKQTAEEVSTVWLEFAKASYKDRLQQIEKAQKASDKNWFNELFNAVEVYAATLVPDQHTLASRLIEQCVAGRGVGASRKMVAEDIALTLPLQ